MWGYGDNALRYPADICIDAECNVFVLDGGNMRVQIFTDTGTYLATMERGFGDARSAGMAIDASGRVYVSDIPRRRVLVFE